MTVRGGREHAGAGKTFVGFGFGPIQSGLFLFEAFKSGNFRRLVISEVDQSLVDAVRRNGGSYACNVARKDHIDHCHVEGVELYNPRDAEGRARLVEAIAESDEMATALPSVRFYDEGKSSAARLIDEGLAARTRPMPTVVYAAENHNHAAEILSERIALHAPKDALRGFAALNTVIGKMSGVITDAPTIERMGLGTMTPEIPRAVLVEEFNRILISRIDIPGYRRGIEVFVEKDDLLPFEEAKLYGHNAIHSLIAYLADVKGMTTIADAGRDEWIMSVARKAFVDESGAALIKRHAGLHDPLFTPEGYRAYADDLLDRMTRPTLNDLVPRVGRDHARKLAYDDRLYGTMHIALDYGITPHNLALGAAAGVLSFIKRRDETPKPPAHLPATASELTRPALEALLAELWGAKADSRARAMMDLTWEALGRLNGQG